MRPVTNGQWQDAIDAAHAMLTLEAARLYGLVTGGPEVNIERCVEILEDGRVRGIEPRIDAVKRLVAGINSPLPHEPSADAPVDLDAEAELQEVL